jgi:hypothetical protein
MNYKNFMYQTIDSIFTTNQLENVLILNAYELRTSIAVNNGDGTFSMKPLPTEAQLSPTFAILIDDFDHDGTKDIILAGNLFSAKPEVGRYDASYGTYLKGSENLEFTAVPAKYSGLRIDGEVRDLEIIETKRGKRIFVARNNDTIQIFDIK